jgi:methionine-rich copper-binding protein CopC
LPLAAWAHAYVVSTSPASGDVVTSSPGRVTVVYDEPVTISAGALAVYAANGKRVDSGKVLQPVGDSGVLVSTTNVHRERGHPATACRHHVFSVLLFPQGG